MQSIILIGLDESLLRTRAAVLKQTGLETVCVSPGEFLDKAAQCRPDLVVLCHTLSEDAANALGRVVHRRWPRARVLAVQRRGALSLDTGVAEADAMTWSDPERLLRAAAEQVAMGVYPSSEPAGWSVTAYLN